MSSITPASFLMADSTTYAFQFNRFSTTPIPLDSTLILTFSTAYQNQVSGSPVCTSDLHNQQITCSNSPEGTVTVTGLFSASSNLTQQSFKVVVGQITNPLPSKSYVPVEKVQIISSNGSTFQEADSTLSVTPTIKSASCQSTISTNIVYQTGNMDVSFASQFNESIQFYKISMPIFYSDDLNNKNIDPVFEPFAIDNTINPDETTLIYQTTSFSALFNVSLLMPPSTKPVDNLIIVTSANSEGQFDNCSLSISSTAPVVFSQLSISSETVQQTLVQTFMMKSTVPMQSTDLIKLQFPVGFSVEQVETSINIIGIGFISGIQSNTITRQVSIPAFSTLATGYQANTQLSFSLSIGQPFTISQQDVLVTVMTVDGYKRNQQTYSYIAAKGSIEGLAISCDNYQIGVSADCEVTMTPTHSLFGSGSILLTFDSSFSFENTSSSCPLSGSSYNTNAICTTHANTISFSSLSAANTLAPTLLKLTLPTIPIATSPSDFSITVQTLSQSAVIDEGVTSIALISRELSNSQMQFRSTVLVTGTATVYELLPLLPQEIRDLGLLYDVVIQMPQNIGSSPSILSASNVTFTNNTLSFKSSLPYNTSIQINNLQTYISTQPISINITIGNNNTQYFHISPIITMITPKTINIPTPSQTSKVVYTQFVGSFELIELAVGDYIVLESSYGLFYPINQPNCSSTVICSTSGKLVVSSAAAITTVTLNLNNLDYLGSYTIAFNVFDSGQIYQKMVGQVTISTSETNTMVVKYSQTNPYYQQSTTYRFNITLTTPSADQLAIQPNGFTIDDSPVCISGCSWSISQVNAGEIFSLTLTTNIIIEMSTVNPANFTTSTLFRFTSSSVSSSSKDYLQLVIIEECPFPCRSCNQNNLQQCLTCYPHQTEKYLQGNTCIASCSDGLFSVMNGLYYECNSCDSKCQLCSINSTYCTSCIQDYWVYNFGCVVQCPSDTYQQNSLVLNTSQCKQCPLNCLTCTSSTICLSCGGNFSLLETSCLGTCTDGFYSLNNKCLPCPSSCLTCLIDQCLSCNSTLVRYSGRCIATCPDTTFNTETNGISVCENCLIGCSKCSSNTTCVDCLSTYITFNNTCQKSCPSGYYYDQDTCQNCTSCPTCTFANYQVMCLSCSGGDVIYESYCTAALYCPNDTSSDGQYCISNSCASNCVRCSGSRCLSCSAVYELSENYTCSQIKSTSAFLQAISDIPVPFPFLIATLLLIISSFLLKHNYPKMYSPLYVYSFAGILQFLCLSMWTLLTILWNQNILVPYPITDPLHLCIVVIVVYVKLNIVGSCCFGSKVRGDRKYAVWEKQNSLCCLGFMRILSTVFSFRFEGAKFSKTGHSQFFSCRLQSPQKFMYFKYLSLASIFVISLFSISVSIYITALQTQLTFLFFTSLQVSILSVVMIIMSITIMFIPDSQLVEQKEEYHKGFDSDKIDENSVEVLLGMGVEEYQENQSEFKEGKQVMAARRRSEASDYTDSQDLETPINQEQKVIFNDELMGETIQIDSNTKIALDQYMDDELQRYNQIADKYMTQEQLEKNPKVGTIQKQHLPVMNLEGQDSDEQQIEEFEPYEQKTKKTKARRQVGKFTNKAGEEQLEHEEKMELGKEVKKIIEKDKQQQLKKKQQEKAKQIAKVMEYKQKLRKIEEEERKCQQQIKAIQQQEQQKLKAQKQKLKRGMEKKVKSKEKYLLKSETSKMNVEDKLSKIVEMVNSRGKSKEEKSKKMKAQNNSRKNNNSVDRKNQIKLDSMNYNNKDEENLVGEVSPKKVKVRSRSNLKSKSIDKAKQVYIEQNEKSIRSSESGQSKEAYRKMNQPSQIKERSSQYTEQTEPHRVTPVLPQEPIQKIRPQLFSKIDQLQQKAEYYLKPHKKIQNKEYSYDQNDQEVGSSDQEGEELPAEQFIFEDQQRFIDEGNVSAEYQEKKYPTGRVNRRVFDLQPKKNSKSHR